MENFEISETSFATTMALEPFPPTAPHQSNATTTSSNATQTSRKKDKEKKQEKE
jgi:hypothetical protein